MSPRLDDIPIDYRLFVDPRMARAVAKHEGVPRSEWTRRGIPPETLWDRIEIPFWAVLFSMVGISVFLLLISLLAYHYCDRWGLPWPGLEWTGMCALGRLG